MNLHWPLMENNITRNDLDFVIEFLKGMPILTQSTNVKALEEEWSRWLGVEYSVFLNSGSSANFISMAILRHLYGPGEIIVPPLTWVSDIASVLHAGFTPVFVDINPRTLSMDNDQVISRISPKTKAVFLTHVQGFNGLSDRLLKVLKEKNVPLIEDACESHGATFRGQKLGSFGLISNFSFYFAHHMSTIEGGMISTNEAQIYQMARMYRSHGMVREMNDEGLKQKYIQENPELNPEFIFLYPGYNMRNTEISAVLGRNQLKRLDANNMKRTNNLKLFLENLDPNKYRTDFELKGCSNYAFNLVLKKADAPLCAKVMKALRESGVEFRRGSAGGGNQMRQPYLKGIIKEGEYKNFPEVEHVHFYGFYIGNYPDLQAHKILALCDLLNKL